MKRKTKKFAEDNFAIRDKDSLLDVFENRKNL